jgi:hypothetical protein
MKVEVDITKTEANALRRFLGLKTKTSSVACLKALLRLVVEDPHELEILMYEKRT